ncbi:MAG TPA: divalent-cation tolerance protein CutA [Allosphingosinicella sp.]|jgi:periplasmic divalent cation tolerance protein|uniref:divalent-cation tolerance protein CutA n=1 Tax=Allosphingosinicella sp. TaxID=2823234 RepID=UPI002F2A4449
MSGIASVYATFPDMEEAERIGRILVEGRLAACVNILGPCRSIYHWEGAIEQATEVAALFKTSTAQAERLIERLSELHSYDVPAAVAWPIERTFPAFEQWVKTETENNPREVI